MVEIAKAFSYDSKILILDEPTNGLDPIGIKEMRKRFCCYSKGVSGGAAIRKEIVNAITQNVLNNDDDIAGWVEEIEQGNLELEKRGWKSIRIRWSEYNKKSLEEKQEFIKIPQDFERYYIVYNVIIYLSAVYF